MFSIDDLDDDLTGGIVPEASDNAPQAPSPTESFIDPLVPGSAAAKALYQVWSGAPVTIVDSPPGAGKSTLIAQVVSHLEAGSDLAVAVVTPTRRQAVDIAFRIAEKTEPRTVWLGIKDVMKADCPEGREQDVNLLTTPRAPRTGKGTVLVNTLSSLKFSKQTVDVLIIDEAYQTKYGDVLSAASEARQVLLVGDPGQIGPVVTVDTTAWEHLDYAPHRRAPEVFAGREDAEVLHLPSTYRFGQETVDCIAPLYDFAFDSARPQRYLLDADEIETVELFHCPDAHDMTMLAEVAGRAASMVGRRLVTEDGERDLEPQDVAVVVSHNAQVGAVKGHLANMGIDGVAVGTADKLQGGQWEAVVALDPLAGATAVDSHSMSLGRLCVMLSRHRASLSFMHDGRWADLLDSDPDLSDDERDRAIAVREKLTNR